MGIVGNLLDLTSIERRLGNPELDVFEGGATIYYRPKWHSDFSNSDRENTMRTRLKKLDELNTHPSAKELIQAVINKKDGIYTYQTLHGKTSKAAVATFEAWNNIGETWSIVSLTPFSSIEKPIDNLQLVLILVGIVAIALISLIIFIFIRTTIR